MPVESVNIFRLAETHWAVQVCTKTVEARRVFDLVGEKMFEVRKYADISL